ncbi:MAG: hypothetical protein KC656_06100 [Myxococcales bacterium]|nr:hypothetical protein [Myxococcales bacterium]
MERLTTGLFDAAKASVNLAIGLVGAMAFFLGLMKVAEAGGMLAAVARAIRPVMELLFPDVPADHPAMGAMIMNMSANALGLGNAATPFGIKAMQELDTLSTEKGTATNAMALFLAINTSSVTLLPTGVIALRDVMGSQSPAGIMGTTLFATLLSSSTAVVAAKVLSRTSPDPGAAPHAGASGWTALAFFPGLAWGAGMMVLTVVGQWLGIVALIASVLGVLPVARRNAGLLLGLYGTVAGALVVLLVAWGSAIGPWVVPAIVLGLLTWGYAAGVPVYETFVEGAKDGFSVATKIIPYLVAILGAVGMLRGSGFIDVFVSVVGPVTGVVGLPAEALPMALLRPLSGSGAYGVMTEIMSTQGPDSYAGYLVSTLQGSTETTFYVLAVYFGAVQVVRIRHAMAAALLADLMGIVGAIVAVQAYFWLNGL